MQSSGLGNPRILSIRGRVLRLLLVAILVTGFGMPQFVFAEPPGAPAPDAVPGQSLASLEESSAPTPGSDPARNSDADRPSGGGVAATAEVIDSTLDPKMLVGAFGTARFEQGDPRIAYSRRWFETASSEMSAGSYRYVRESGATVSVRFEGTSIAWIAPRFSSYGQAEVILDGVSQGVVSQYSPRFEPKQVMWSAYDLPAGEHTLEIRCLYTREPASAGYSVSVDAFDVTGTLLQATPSAPTMRVEDDDPRLTLAGTWHRASNASMSDGVYAYTRSAGASTKVAFKGTSIAWIAPKFSSYGKAEVILDGVSQGVVSQYSPTFKPGQVIWSAYGLPPGEHVLEIRATGDKDPAAAAHSVCVDGFDIRGTAIDAPRPAGFTRVEQTDTRLAWGGHWFTANNATMSGGSYRYSRAGESDVTLTFRGTAVSWIAPKFSSYGYAAVYLNGTLADVVSLYRPDYAAQRVVWSATGLPDATHVVRIRVLGSKEPVSRAHSACVDAFDVVGEVLQSYSLVEDDDPRLHFRSGPWTYVTNPAMSGGSYRYTRTPGARATIVFRGTGISWIGPKFSSYGKAEVYLNAVSQGVVSQYSPTFEPGQTLWEIDGLPEGVHTLTIVALGTKDAASASTSVSLDAVRVAGEVLNAGPAVVRAEERDGRFVYLGDWTDGGHSSLSGGTYRYSRQRNAEIRVAFKGTEITWLGTKAPSYGKAHVYLDGKYVTTVDLYSRSMQSQRVVWAANGLTNTQHELRIIVARSMGPGSSGYTVTADAFEVTGTFLQAKPPEPPVVKSPFSYPWASYIVVDKSDRKLYLVKDHKLVATYPVAIGRSNAETPVGVWRIDSKYITTATGIYGPRKMRMYRRAANGSFVYTAYNIHGTNVPSSIGTKASAGCVRLYNSDILKLYPQVPLRTMVVTRE